MPTKILIVGGAGFIGSHMVDCLLRSGYQPIVLDNLSTGHRESIGAADYVIGDMGDPVVLDALFSRHSFDAVMHFASFIRVGESVLDPAKYYQNNVVNTLQLLQSMIKWKVKRFIFSSTAAVYGQPSYSPIDEAHPVCPINPYGQSKWMVEKMLEDFARAYDFNYMTLRYFNAAGAHPEGKLGELHEPETHLIPLALQAAFQQGSPLTIYGQDYSTPDGTCIRDYIHVSDLCSAHLLALKALSADNKYRTFNLGTGEGYSVKQVIDTVEKITGLSISLKSGERRKGDPERLVADATLAKKILRWQPQFSQLETIITHAWQFYSAQIEHTCE